MGYLVVPKAAVYPEPPVVPRTHLRNRRRGRRKVVLEKQGSDGAVSERMSGSLDSHDNIHLSHHHHHHNHNHQHPPSKRAGKKKTKKRSRKVRRNGEGKGKGKRSAGRARLRSRARAEAAVPH